MLNFLKSLSDEEQITKAFLGLSKNVGLNSEFSGDKDQNFKIEEKKLRHFRVRPLFLRVMFRPTLGIYFSLFEERNFRVIFLHFALARSPFLRDNTPKTNSPKISTYLFQLSYNNKTGNLDTLNASREFHRPPHMDEITRAAAERFRPQKEKYFYLFGADNRNQGFR